MADWRGALTYPFRGPERERPFVVVWVLLLGAAAVPTVRFLSVLGLLGSLVVAVPLVGYLVYVLVASENGEPMPGVVAAWPGLLRRGIGGAIVAGCYLAIPVVLLGVTLYGAVWLESVPDPNAVSGLTLYAGSTAVLFLSLVGAYLLPVGLADYGQTGSLRAAFSASDLRAVATNAAYFAGWTASVGLFGFVVATAAGIAVATRAGPLLAGAMTAYALLVTVHVWGRCLARAR